MSSDSQNTVVQYEEDEVQSPTENLYFIGLVLYMLRYLDYETRWEIPGMLSFAMLLLSFALLTIQLLQAFQRYSSREVPVVVFAFLVTLVAGFNSDMLEPLLGTFLLVCGAKGIEFRKIAKVFLVVGGTFCAVTVIASLMGVIENLTDKIDGERESLVTNFQRQCLGYGWSTNMANHVFFIILTYFFWVNRLLKFKEIIIFLALTLWVLGRTDSRLSTACIVLLLVFSVLYRLRLFQRIVLSRPMALLFVVTIPFFAVISYYVTAAYDSKSLEWMVADALLSGRLRIGQEALDSAGVSFLGQVFVMFSSARSDGANYNYVDCSYLQLLIIYGFVYTVLIISAYMVIVRQALRRGDILLVIAVITAAISGLIAQHFIEIYMNPFLIALFASHQESLEVLPEEAEAEYEPSVLES